MVGDPGPEAGSQSSSGNRCRYGASPAVLSSDGMSSGRPTGCEGPGDPVGSRERTSVRRPATTGDDATNAVPSAPSATSLRGPRGSRDSRTARPASYSETSPRTGSATRIRPARSTSNDVGPSVSASKPGTRPARPGPLPQARYRATFPRWTSPNVTGGTATEGMSLVT